MLGIERKKNAYRLVRHFFLPSGVCRYVSCDTSDWHLQWHGTFRINFAPLKWKGVRCLILSLRVFNQICDHHEFCPCTPSFLHDTFYLMSENCFYERTFLFSDAWRKKCWIWLFFWAVKQFLYDSTQNKLSKSPKFGPAQFWKTGKHVAPTT